MKTLVNIITEDNPIPAYLFIKEMFQPGDRIMYISAKDTEDDLDWLAVIDGVSTDVIDEIVLKNDIDEFKYENICRTVKGYLKKETHYCVNLAGGTRYMALAVQQVFEDFDSEFYYVNLEDNTIIRSKFDDSIYNNDDFFYPIKYRMSIAEYLSAHELQHDINKPSHEPLYPFELSENMFQMFSQGLLSDREMYIMEMLRQGYRDRKNGVAISVIENPPRPEWQKIPDIQVFLNTLSIPCANGKLSRRQIEWITGGWFEEYVYYRVKKTVVPDFITLGLHISRKGVKRNNELDVVFMKDNHLYVVECKTGVETEHKFSEIVYKACALKESLLGVSCCSFIASLKRDSTDDLKKIAANMDIVFWDYTIMTSKLGKVLKELGGRHN